MYSPNWIIKCIAQMGHVNKTGSTPFKTKGWLVINPQTILLGNRLYLFTQWQTFALPVCQAAPHAQMYFSNPLGDFAPFEPLHFGDYS